MFKCDIYAVGERYALLAHLKSTGDRTRDPLHVGINAYLIELYSNHVHVLALMLN